MVKTKERAGPIGVVGGDGEIEDLVKGTKRDMAAAERDDFDFLTDAEPQSVDQLRALVLSQLQPAIQSWAATRNELRWARRNAADFPRADRKPFTDRIKAIQKDVLPAVERRLNDVLRDIATLLAEDSLDGQVQRNAVDTWASLPQPFRGRLAGYLKRQGYDVSEVVAKADALERERKERVAAGDEPPEA